MAIARALAMSPDYMLFDEVTSALDPQLVGEVLDTLLSRQVISRAEYHRASADLRIAEPVEQATGSRHSGLDRRTRPPTRPWTDLQGGPDFRG